MACACSANKKLYRSYRVAIRVVLRRLRSGPDSLRVYRCPVLGGYHLTKQKKRELTA